MNFNLENIGRNLALIEGGKYDNKIISVCDEDDEDVKISFKNLTLQKKSKFQQIPDKDSERQILYITGPSGSGKSTYTSNYLKQYKKMYKNNPIYLFSNLKEDEVLDVFEPKRIKLGKNLLDSPLNAELFKNSLCIFDDTDSISNKQIKEAVYSFLKVLLNTGRHHNISCILTNHMPTARKDTAEILNECHTITYFPHSGSKRGLNYLLKDYIGLDNDTIRYIKKTKSRWATIFKNYPQIIMTETTINFIEDDDDDEDNNKNDKKEPKKMEGGVDLAQPHNMIDNKGLTGDGKKKRGRPKKNTEEK